MSQDLADRRELNHRNKRIPINRHPNQKRSTSRLPAQHAALHFSNRYPDPKNKQLKQATLMQTTQNKH